MAPFFRYKTAANNAGKNHKNGIQYRFLANDTIQGELIKVIKKIAANKLS